MPPFDLSVKGLTFLCRQEAGVLAGRPFFDAVFRELDCVVSWGVEEGAEVTQQRKLRGGVMRESRSSLRSAAHERGRGRCLERKDPQNVGIIWQIEH